MTATSVTQATEVTPDRWSLEHYHQAIAAGWFGDQRIELLQGVLSEMPLEGEPHAYYSSETGDYLRTLLRNRAKVRETHLITLPDHSEPMPDLAIVHPLRSFCLQQHSHLQ